MKAIWHNARDFLYQLVRDFFDGWARFWFTPVDTTTLAMLRICAGLTLLALYGSLLPEVPDYLGADGWVDQQAMHQLRAAAPSRMTDAMAAGSSAAMPSVDPWFAQSLWYHVEHPTLIMLFYWYFLAAIACFTIGLFSRTSNALVWIGHISCAQRSIVTTYGVDVILAMLLLYLLIGPTGRSLSVDRLLANYWLRDSGRPRSETSECSWLANFSVRLIQVHMCVIYICAGLSKLQGESWWDGSALWLTLMMPEMNPLDMNWFTALGDGPIQVICALGTVLTIGYEISFAFLIWNRRLRPLVLALAVLLHGGIGLFMGLGVFSAAMLTGCLAFVDPLAMRWCLSQLTPNVTRTPAISAAAS